MTEGRASCLDDVSRKFADDHRKINGPQFSKPGCKMSRAFFYREQELSDVSSYGSPPTFAAPFPRRPFVPVASNLSDAAPIICSAKTTSIRSDNSTLSVVPFCTYNVWANRHSRLQTSFHCLNGQGVAEDAQ